MEKFVCFKNSRGLLLAGSMHIPEPEPTVNRVGCLFLEGATDCRTSAHRIYVKIARRLSRMGLYSLRFDYSGRGDSGGETKELSSDELIADSRSAIDYFKHECGIDRMVILGISRGGALTILVAGHDPCIKALIPISTSCYGGTTLLDKAAKMRVRARIYMKKVAKVETWKRMLCFDIDVMTIVRLIFCLDWKRNRIDTSVGGKRGVQDKRDDARITYEDMARILSDPAFDKRILFIYGGDEFIVLDSIRPFSRLCGKNNIQHSIKVIKGADHGLSSLQWEREAMDEIVRFLSDLMARHDGST